LEAVVLEAQITLSAVRQLGWATLPLLLVADAVQLMQ
jgi:hypothetical protein